MAMNKNYIVIGMIAVVIIMIFVLKFPTQSIVNKTGGYTQSDCEELRADQAARGYTTYGCYAITNPIKTCVLQRYTNDICGFSDIGNNWVYLWTNYGMIDWDINSRICAGCIGISIPGFNINNCMGDKCTVNSDCTGCGSGSYSCNNGQCQQATTPLCVDSDYGVNYHDFGTTQGLNGNFNDHCSDSHHLNEYYCDANNNVQVQNVLCPGGANCASGMCNVINQPTFTVQNPIISQDGQAINVQVQVTSDTTIRAIVEGQISTSSSLAPTLSVIDYLNRNQCDEARGITPTNWHFLNDYIDFTANVPHYVTFEFTPQSAGNPYYVYFNMGSQCCISTPCTTGQDFFNMVKLGSVVFGGTTPVCTSGQRQCSGSSAYQICTASNTWGTATNCPSGQSCDGGNCYPSTQCTYGVTEDCDTLAEFNSVKNQFYANTCTPQQLIQCTSFFQSRPCSYPSIIPCNTQAQVDQISQEWANGRTACTATVLAQCTAHFQNTCNPACASGQTCVNGVCTGGTTSRCGAADTNNNNIVERTELNVYMNKWALSQGPTRIDVNNAMNKWVIGC